jgi:hypothetical protein
MEEVETKEVTLGERRLGTKFNPSGLAWVSIVKNRTAEIIDGLEKHRKPIEENENQEEINRLITIAQETYENATMWAVKAITKK